jgi:sulfonate transport system substrate-binding protein
MPSRPPHRALRGRTVAVCSAAALVASTGATITSSSTAAAASAIPPGITLNVGDQNQSAETLFQSSGLLKGAPYKVNFVEFSNGPLIDAALESNKLDLGAMGDTPAQGAVSEHLPVKAVLTSLPIGASSWLVARPGINSIAQLRGKKVAYTTGTAQQAFALRALATAGLTQHDVQQVNVTLQQLGTVIESGNADASILSVQYKTDYLEQEPHAKVLANNATSKPPAYGYTVAATKSLDNPGRLAAIKDYIHRDIEANVWERSHKTQWIQDYYVDVEHQTTQQAKAILAAGGLSQFVPIGKKQENALQGVVKLLVNSGAIPKSFSVAPLYSPEIEAMSNGILAQTLAAKGKAQQG